MTYTAQQMVDVLSRAADVIRYMVREDLSTALESGDAVTEVLEHITMLSVTADRVVDICAHVEDARGITATPIPVK